MFLPPFESLLRAIGLDRSTYSKDLTITLPKGIFNLLIELALINAEFNEAGYLKDNPDVVEGLRRGQMINALQHYAKFGYFEGRTGATPPVDEAWYLSTYPDVAYAAQRGQIASAKEHYNTIGAGEGRSPNGSNVASALCWKNALSSASTTRGA